MDDDNEFIVNSGLHSVMNFSDDFDPFFMHQYQHMKKYPDDPVNQDVKNLYNFGIPYAYQMIRNNKKMTEGIKKASRISL